MDVKAITGNVISNYDVYSQKLLNLLKTIGGHLVCKLSLKDCIDNRKCYSCAVSFTEKKNRKTRVLDNIWPIMIGSKIDIAVRKMGVTVLRELDGLPNLLQFDRIGDPADIALTSFVINGAAKMVPFFVTNDVTNIHIVRQNVVRIYRYNAEQRGMELNLYMDDEEYHERGELSMRLYSGEERYPTERELSSFFSCPYPVTSTKDLFQFVFTDKFDIDHLGNKVVFTPGHLFYRLFCKTLYIPIKTNDEKWRRKHRVVSKSIENGDLLHVLSKKTLFYKEAETPNKMVSGGAQQRKEIGTNHQVFVEKKSTCYRDVNFQTYQLIPYLSQMTFFQISSKVKTNSVLTFNDSYEGWLCLFGTTESKNVGRQMMLARNVFVSADDDPEPLYEWLQIVHSPLSKRFVVVNAACIPVDADYWERLDLIRLKLQCRFVECYRKRNFVFVTLKRGLLFKHFKNGIWVTPNDISYWTERLGPWEGFDFITSHFIDIVPYFQHNAFPKNLLALNSIKNSVLAETPEYAIYFRETLSAYQPAKPGYHTTVLEPKNEFSKPWTLRLPKPRAMFASFLGRTQEDCIVMREGVDAFDCHKVYTLKVKINNGGKTYFHAAKGESGDPSRTFIGTIACMTAPALEVMPMTIHVHIEKVNGRALNVYFTKPRFRVVRSEIAGSHLFVTVENDHPYSVGDKLCSLAGQKGVIFKSAEVPYAVDDGNVVVKPDLILNPNSLIGRQTMGQILEMRDSGKDYDVIHNSKGAVIPGAKALIGSAFYFAINYLSSEHIYVAMHCMRDKILGQPLKGRSRLGGMRCGGMEIINGFRGNGLSACYEEKLLEHSDLIVTEDGVRVPKSMYLCEGDARFFKCTMKTVTHPLVVECNKNKKWQNVPIVSTIRRQPARKRKRPID